MTPAFKRIVRYDNVLPLVLLDALSELAAASDDLPGTFWHPLGDGPGNAVSAAALVLSELTPEANGAVGVEWWARTRDAGAAMALHLDKDETLLRDTGQLRHPICSGVLYLSDEGGPTVILEEPAAIDGPEYSPRPEDRCLLSYPKRNGFLVFPGDLLHGVLAQQPAGRTHRRTLLINWWSDRPAAPGCREPGLAADGNWNSIGTRQRPPRGMLVETTVGELTRG